MVPPLDNKYYILSEQGVTNLVYHYKAREHVEVLMKQMSKQLVVTEELKRKNQMEWVGKMNNIKSAAEEIVCKNILYV